jgi:TRAP-type C4-dicarboxylate transport system substrate-binding protein
MAGGLRSPQDGVKSMVKGFIRSALLGLALLPSLASAQPIKLKLSLVTSDRALVYQGSDKPFVDAVNAEAKGLLEIEVYFSGALGKQSAQQPQLVADGIADIAFIVTGQTPERFYDNAVIELPGLFKNSDEAGLVFTRLIAAGALKGYEDFFVISAFLSPAESIHSRTPIASIADLKGMSVRTNNVTEGAALQKLGMRPVSMPVNLVAEAIGNGTLDAATAPPTMLFETGIGRVTSYHYLLDVSGAPLALVMNRKTFDGLPGQAQDIIRKYSGEWQFTQTPRPHAVVSQETMEQLTSNPRRQIIYPSELDLETAQAAFKSAIDEWVAKSPANRKQLEVVQAEIANVRAGR